MNKQQRAKLQTIIDDLSIIQEQEQEKYDNMPEGLQETDRAYKFEENADTIQEAIDTLEVLMESD